MNRSIRQALTLSFLLLAPDLKKGWADAGVTVPRIPIGIYAVVPVEKVVNDKQGNPFLLTIPEMDGYLTGFYTQLLNNPAVAGLALQIHWDTLNPNAPKSPTDPNAYFWNYVQDAFDSVHQWNSANPYQTAKTIQILVSPGFFTPKWVLKNLTSCDGLFDSSLPTPTSTCGKVTFTDIKECADFPTECTVLPMPWNTDYKSYWRTFLKALAATEYASDPSLVSIAVAGPTAASVEMILPHDGATPAQTQFSPATPSISPNDMWLKLLENHYEPMPESKPASYYTSDQAFVDEWNSAIDMYGSVFKGLTLVVTTGSGLPDLLSSLPTSPSSPSSPYSYSSLLTWECTKSTTKDCAAETAILFHFGESSVGGNNNKSTQTSGIEASKVGMDLGIDGVRNLTYNAMTQPSASTRILGGGQFNRRFSIPTQTAQEGCTGQPLPPCPPISPEQAAYNALEVFFNGTQAADTLVGVTWGFSGTRGYAPLNYLQIYWEDIQYATTNTMNDATVTRNVLDTLGWSVCPGTGCTTFLVSAQNLLETASAQLFLISEVEPSL